jgi:hypothetical protein
MRRSSIRLASRPISTSWLTRGLQDEAHLSRLEHPVQGTQRFVRASPAPEAVRAVHEDRLVDRLQHLGQRPLHHLVGDARDADRPRLALALRDVHPPDGLVPVAHRPHLPMQLAEVVLQFLPVLLLRDAIHAYGRVLAESVVGAPQRLLVEQVRQREEAHARVALRSPRSPHYLQKSR